MRIDVIDVNDELPRFVNTPHPFLATVATNAPPGTSVFRLEAVDPDGGSVVRYKLESGEDCEDGEAALCSVAVVP